VKELIVQHVPATDGAPPKVRVSYRKDERSQAQVREGPFAFAVTDEQRHLLQWYLEESLGCPWGPYRARAAEAEALMQRLGVELFNAAFGAGDTRDLYVHVADDLSNTRFIVHADHPEGIALPWELIHDNRLGPHGDLARLAHAFVRSQPDLIFDPPAPAAGTTFNILIVICRPPRPDNKEDPVAFQSVARPLLELFRPHRDRIRLDVLRPPTLEQLGRVLTDRPNFYHVLHFDGHGTFPQGGGPGRYSGQAGAQGRLLFEGEDGRHREVTGEELGGVLAGKGVPVVLLNACQSGMTRPEATYPSVGNQLLKAGAAGVVAMAYSVYVQTAVRFMARLYERLIGGLELARAVALAREELRNHPQRSSPVGDIELRDWVTPVLLEAAPVRLVEKPPTELRLNPDLLHDEQARAGTEIDCPEAPAFGLVGRDSIMLELERAFQTETLVLLEGMAGVGKTEAAVGFARWRAETGALDGPVFFFRFEHHKPLAHVCDRVGQVFQKAIKQQLQAEWQLLDAEQRRAVALAVLKQVPCFLVWDNFEPVAGFPTGSPSDWTAEEQRELREFLSDLRGGRTKVLLTSRRDEPWLGNIYRRVELGGLRLIEAQELAVRVLKRAGLNAEQLRGLGDYNALLKYLRGNPLAVQVIVPELKRRKPEDLLQALQAGEVKLAHDDPKQGRERSLAASLNYRLDALDPMVRQRLAVLALFQGFVVAGVLALMSKEADVSESLRGLKREDWVRVLNTATEIGFLQRIGGGYYTVHPALPWFFHDLQQEVFPDRLADLEQAFATLYGAYGHELSQLFKTNTQLAMSLLRAEEDNLLFALRLARRHEEWGSVEGVLDGLNQLYTIQGRWLEWERHVSSVEAQCADEKGEPLAGREELWRAVLGYRSEIAYYQRDFDKLRSNALRLKDHYESVGDDSNRAASLHQLGMVAQERWRWDEAEDWYRQSLAIEERIGYENGQAQTLHQLGNIAYLRRRWDEAEDWYRQSLAIKERIGDEHGQARTLHQLGMVVQARGRWDKAEDWYRQSLAIKERIGDEHGQALSLHQLGMVAQERRRWGEAEDLYRQCLAIAKRIGNEHGQASTLHQLGMVAQARGHWDEAEDWYRQSLAIKERIGDEHGQALSLHQLGMVAQERRRWDEAEDWYRQSLAIAKRIGDEHGQAQTLHQLGRVAEERRRWDEAEDWYRQSLAINDRFGDEHGQAGTLHQLGMVAEERGNLPEAKQFYQQAEAIFVRSNDPHSLEIVRRSLQRLEGKLKPPDPPAEASS
jgi:tetratricopeptide (TPR) repeat protein